MIRTIPPLDSIVAPKARGGEFFNSLSQEQKLCQPGKNLRTPPVSGLSGRTLTLPTLINPAVGSGLAAPYHELLCRWTDGNAE